MNSLVGFILFVFVSSIVVFVNKQFRYWVGSIISGFRNG